MVYTGFKCYLTVREREYLHQLIKRDMRGRPKDSRKIWVSKIYAKLEDLFPDKDELFEIEGDIVEVFMT